MLLDIATPVEPLVGAMDANDGASVSTTIAFCPEILDPDPVAGKVTTAEFPHASAIVPPFRVRAVVDVYSRSAVLSPD